MKHIIRVYMDDTLLNEETFDGKINPNFLDENYYRQKYIDSLHLKVK